MTSEIKTPAVLDNHHLAVTAGWVTVFNIILPSREYLSSAEEYLAEGVGIPANAYLDKPLKAKKGFAVCRSADNSQWEYLPDHRGEIRYSTVTGMAMTVNDIGDYPMDTTDLAPITVLISGMAHNGWPIPTSKRRLLAGTEMILSVPPIP